MSKIHPAIELAAVLAQEAASGHCPEGRCNPAPDLIAEDAVSLLRIGARVERWAVRYCNGEGRTWKSWPNGGGSYVWSETDDAAKEKADARHLKQATEIAARYGATVTIGGDPRGFVLRLNLASGRKNGWGDGWGVV